MSPIPLRNDYKGVGFNIIMRKDGEEEAEGETDWFGALCCAC